MSVSNLLELFGQSLKEDLQSNLKTKMAAKSKNGFSGDTRLEASIRISYVDNDGDIIGVDLYLNNYYQWVNAGRAAGKGISKEGQISLEKWIKSRGLNKGLSPLKKKQIKAIKNKTVRKSVKQVSQEKVIKRIVFAISKKIKERGYEATHFFNEVLYDGRLEKLKQRMKEEYGKDLQLEIIAPHKK